MKKQQYSVYKTFLKINSVVIILLFSSLSMTVISKEENPITNEDTVKDISMTYTVLFSEPTIQKTQLSDILFSKMDMAGTYLTATKQGDPIIPAKPLSILLPQGTEIDTIIIKPIKQKRVDTTLQDIDLTTYPLMPYQGQKSLGTPAPTTILFNNETYESSSIIPNKTFDHVSMGYCKGYAIAMTTLYPLTYQPLKGEISYYPQINITINLKNTTQQNPYYRGLPEDEQWVQSLVINPEITSTYQNTRDSFYSGGLCNPSDNSGMGYDYVIITTEALYNFSATYTWDDLINRKQSEGLQATKIKVEDIFSCSDYWNTSSLFNDTAAQIREFCKDAYLDWDTQYILIGGDDNGVNAIQRREMDGQAESNVETDIYWTHLDNTFNNDGDSDWGEENDGGFDYYSELYSGSIPCDEGIDVSNWLTKSFYYADSYDLDYLDNAAFYGGNTGWDAQGDTVIEFSAIKGTDDWMGPNPHGDGPYPAWLGFQWGFETWNTHYPQSAFNLSVKWTAEPPNPGWQGGSESASIDGLKNAINNDQCTLISAVAHANSGMSMDVYSSSWESNYHNTKPFFLTDQGCHCGDMDASDDGVLHSMLFHDDTELAFACVYNTGYGWGNYDGTNASSAIQMKSFWDYLFDMTNNSQSPTNWQLGKAQEWSRDLMAPAINWNPDGDDGAFRNTIQSCLLFGDPAQKLKIPYLPDHDIMVSNLEIPNVVAHGETQQVSALITNAGNSSEVNVLINFTVDDIVLDNIVIPTLESLESTAISFNWNPGFGTYVVAIVATPVPEENATDNNQQNKTVDVIAAPDVYVSPVSLEFHVNAGDADSDTLLVGNEVWAEASLHFNVSVSSGAGSWLSVNPVTGIVPVGSSVGLTVSVDAALLTEGVYSGFVMVDCDDLDEPVVSVPVDLFVVFGDDVGAINVNYPIGQQLPGGYTVNATVENFGSVGNSFVVNCSIFSGVNLLEDFEDDDGGYSGTVEWEWGVPTSGPGSAHSGSNCWATNLGGDYADDADEWVDSVPLGIPSGVPVELGFWQWYDFEDGSSHYDGGNVKVSVDGGISWSMLGSYLDPYPVESCYSGNSGIPGEPCFTGTSSGWEFVSFDLSGFAGETVLFSWHFGTDSSSTRDGWFIDDVTVSVQGSLDTMDGTPVYTSSASVFVDAYETAFVEFSPVWDVNQMGYYAIKVVTGLVGDEDVSNDEFMGVVEIASAPMGHVCVLSAGWNFVSGPFNESVLKENMMVVFDSVSYGWVDAVAGGLVSDVLFGWNGVSQSYVFGAGLVPGDGFWVYSFVDCELRAPVFSVNFDGRVCSLVGGWNVVGLPFNAPKLKDSLVVDNGVAYDWSDAVTAGLVSDVLFGWESVGQSYVFVDGLYPGCAVWLYAYDDCVLESPID